MRFGKDEVSTNTTEYAFQIERWDKTNKVAEIWVKVPQILGNNSQQAIKMYWGHANPPTPPINDPVFSNNYAGVWHLGEKASTSAQGFTDGSPNGNHGTGVLLNTSSSVPGMQGNATYFNGTVVSGTAQSITTLNNSASLHPTGQLSIEFWVKANTQAQFKRLVSKAFTSSAYPWNEYDVEQGVQANTLTFAISIGGQGKYLSNTTPMAIGQWYHITATYDQANMRIYLNGALDGAMGQTGSINDFSRPVTLGKYEHDAASNFNGTLDEVRISNTARSADWVKLSYMNQREDQKLVENASTPLFTGGPGVLFQKFDGIADGNNISTLTTAPQFPLDPTVTRVYPGLTWSYPPPANDPVPGAASKFGVRMSAWVQAPDDGQYTFWIQGDDRVELWLSSDANPINKSRVAYVPDWTTPDVAGWTKNPQQKSAAITLVKDHLYFIEAFMSQESGGAHMSVGWTVGSATTVQAIPSTRLFLDSVNSLL